MRRWLGRRAAPEAPWREVPRVDVLVREQASPGRRLMRVALLALLLGATYLAGSLYLEGETVQRDLEHAGTQLESAQEELASRSNQAEQLQAQLADLQQRQQKTEQERQQLNAAKIQWQPVLAALEALLGEEEQFESLEGGAGGELTLVATIADEQALARLQGSLQDPGQPFTVQTADWQRDSGHLTLTATLQVAP